MTHTRPETRDDVCRCGHAQSRHFGPTHAGPCDRQCGCLGFRYPS